jgi:hypothetical protein
MTKLIETFCRFHFCSRRKKKVSYTARPLPESTSTSSKWTMIQQFQDRGILSEFFFRIWQFLRHSTNSRTWQSSLLCSHLTTCLCPGPNHLISRIYLEYILKLFSRLRVNLPSSFLLQVSFTTNLHALLLSPARATRAACTTLRKDEDANRETPHFAIVFGLMIFPPSWVHNAFLSTTLCSPYTPNFTRIYTKYKRQNFSVLIFRLVHKTAKRDY